MQGSEYLFFTITALSGQKSMHKHRVLSFFATKRVGQPHGEQLGQMLWQNHLKNEGSIFQDSDRVILNKARMKQTHIRSIQNQNFIEN
jgi:hypothetical protein